MSSIIKHSGAIRVGKFATVDAPPAEKGLMFFDTTLNKFRQSVDGSTFVDVPAGSISGVIYADGSVAFTADQSMGGFKLTNLAAPVSNGDAATKLYVDTSTGTSIAKAIVDAKGDLIVATAADTVARVAVGTDGQVLVADSTQTAGVKWDTPTTGADTALSNLTTTSIAQSLVPSADNTVDLGNITTRWREVFAEKVTLGPTVGSLDANGITVHAAGITIDTGGNLTVDSTVSIDSTGINMGSTGITLLSDPVGAQDAATKNYVDTTAVLLGGSTMTGNLAMGGNSITGIADGVAAQDAVSKSQMDTADGLKVSKTGDTMSGNLAMGNNLVTGLAAPVSANDAVNKAYADALSAGSVWLDPINDPDLVDDSLSAPPGSPVVGDTYIVAATATGAWTGLEGRAVFYDGASWVDILGRAVIAGDRFGVSLETPTAGAGGLSTKENQIAEIVSPTPGSITYTFTAPVTGQAVFVFNTASTHSGHQYNYNGTAWIEFGGASAITPGVGLSFSGNVLNVNLGAGVAQLPSDEVGVDVHTSGGLFTTVDNSTSSTLTGAQLAVKLDGATLSKSSSGLKVAALGITNSEVSASAAIAQSKMAALTASRAMTTDASGFASASAVTSTELGYLSGVTSAIQTQLGSKANTDLSNVAGTAVSADLIFGVAVVGNVGTRDHGPGAGNTEPMSVFSGSNSSGTNGTSSGSLSLYTGSANAGVSGDLMLYTGGTNGGFTSGSVSIISGDKSGSGNGWSGGVTIATGTKGASGTGSTGDVNITTGDNSSSSSGSSGSVILSTGQGIGARNSGSIQIVTGTAGGTRGSVQIEGSIISMQADADFNSLNKIVNLVDPTAAQDGATKNYVDTGDGLKIDKSLLTAKGALISATAASTPAALAVGTNGYVLTADSAEATGLKWAVAAGTGANTTLSNLGTTAINAALTPDGDNTRDLGTTAAGWKDLHLAGKELRGVGSSFVEEEYIHSTTLTASQTNTVLAALSFAHATYEGIEVTYKVKEATTNAVRIGKLSIVTNGTDISVVDSFNETADVGVTWSAVVNGANIDVRYSTTANAKTLRSDIKRFKA